MRKLLVVVFSLAFCVAFAQNNQYIRGKNIFLQNASGSTTYAKFDSAYNLYFPNNSQIYTNKQLGIYSKGYVTSVYSGIVLDSFLVTSEVRNGSTLRTIVNQYPHNWFVSAYNNGFKNGITIDTSTSYALKITTSVGEYTLPRNTPSAGQVLGAVDGSGNLVWGTVCGGKADTTALKDTAAAIRADIAGGGLPSQTGNAGKFLTTDGSAASWSDRLKLASDSSYIKNNSGNIVFGIGEFDEVPYITDGNLYTYPATFLTPNFQVGIDDANVGFILRKTGGSTAILKTDSLTANRTYQFPNTSGILALRSDITGTVSSVAAGYGLNGGTITTTGTLSSDTAKLATIANRDKLKDTIVNKIIYPKQSILNASIYGFGDSFTETSMNASPADSGYINRLKAYTGGTLSNLAVGGRGVWIMEANAYANVTPNTRIITALSGLNDYRRSGYNTKTNNKVYNSYLALMVSQFAKRFVNGCSPEITRSAGWTGAYQGVAVGAKYGPATSPTIPNTTHGVFNGTPLSGTADSLQWTFTGDNVMCGFVGVDNVTYTGYGTLEVYVDGVLKASGDCKNQWDGISDGTNDNGRGTYVIPVFGLTDGTHTVKVKIFGNGYVPFDYFAVLEKPALCYPLYIGDIPHLNSTGYAVSPSNGSDAIVDSGSRVMRSAMSLFRGYGYPAYPVTTNVYYDLTTGLSVDNIHPNNTGHRQIYNAFKAVLDSNYTITTNGFDATPVSHSGWQGYSGTITWSGTPPSGTANHVYRWSRKDDLVTLIIQLNYGTAGVSNTNVLVTLPSDCPTPSFPVASQVASNYVNIGAACIRTGGTASATILQAGLRLNSGGTGYEIQTTTGSSIGAKIATIQIQYWTGQ